MALRCARTGGANCKASAKSVTTTINLFMGVIHPAEGSFVRWTEFDCFITEITARAVKRLSGILMVWKIDRGLKKRSYLKSVVQPRARKTGNLARARSPFCMNLEIVGLEDRRPLRTVSCRWSPVSVPGCRHSYRS